MTNKVKCEVCDDYGYYFLDGLLEEKLKIECRCCKKKDDVHREVIIKNNLVTELR